MEKTDVLTGVATVQYATVQVNVSKKVPPEATLGAGQQSSEPSKTRVGLRIEPTDFITAFSISAEVAHMLKRQFYIKNTGEVTIEAFIRSNLDIVSFDRDRIRLAPIEEVAVTYTILANKPGIYAGKISIESQLLTKEIPLAITAREPENLFGMYLELGSENVMMGGEFPFTVRMVRAEGGIAELVYFIKDANNKMIVRATERKMVNDKLLIQRKLRLPFGIKPGTYIFGVEVRYKGKVDVASRIIKISKRQASVERPTAARRPVAGPLVLSIVIIVLLFIADYILLRRKRFRP